MPRGNQPARPWCLLQFLSWPPGLAVEDAARKLGCAVRTVGRDLRVLHESGFPIFDERDGRRDLCRPAYDFGWMWGELGLDRPG